VIPTHLQQDIFTVGAPLHSEDLPSVAEYFAFSAHVSVELIIIEVDETHAFKSFCKVWTSARLWHIRSQVCVGLAWDALLLTPLVCLYCACYRRSGKCGNRRQESPDVCLRQVVFRTVVVHSHLGLHSECYLPSKVLPMSKHDVHAHCCGIGERT
jgi:hypothetical protein